MLKQHLLGQARIFFLVMCSTFLFSVSAEAQIFKKIGEKIEKSVERRVDRKIDKGVEKGLDKVEDGVDQSVKDATTEKPKDKKPPKQQDEANTSAGIMSIDDTPYSTATAEKAKSNNGMVLVSNNCNDYAWFKKGARLEYKVNSTGTGDNYISSMRVTDVRNEGSKTVANIISSDNEGHEIEMDFICTGNQMYFDLTGMLKSQLEKQGQGGADMDVSFDGGLMAIPKNIYPGQKLDDAVFRMNMTSSGMTISMTSHLKDRKVEGRETVTTPAGTFNCIKISGVRTVSMNMMGTNRKMGKPVTEAMYFAPSVGMIKSVTKDHKGKVEYEQVLTKYDL